MAAVLTRQTPYLYRIIRGGVNGNRTERVVFALLYVTVLIIAAKTNLIDDFDSQWYGLRSDYVLEEGGTIFVNLGLAHFVYYYPKLYETLILPLCAFPDSSYPASLSVLFYAFALYVIHDLIMGGHRGPVACGADSADGRLGPGSGLLSIAGEARFSHRPCVVDRVQVSHAFHGQRGHRRLLPGCCRAGYSAMRETDCDSFRRAHGDREPARIVRIFRRLDIRNEPQGLSGYSGEHLLALLLGFATFVVFTYRTYAITGLPYIAPDFLVGLFKSLGFQAHYPYGELANAQIGDSWHFTWQSLGLIYAALMAPSSLPHMVYSWIGNIFVLLG